MMVPKTSFEHFSVMNEEDGCFYLRPDRILGAVEIPKTEIDLSSLEKVLKQETEMSALSCANY